MEVRKINALEAPCDPDDDELPSQWTPEHVGRRLVDGFKTLRIMPGIRRPREPGGNWPAFCYSEDDLKGWDATAVAERNAEKAAPPTSREIWGAEQALTWIETLRRQDAGLALTVQEWAAARAIDRPMRNLCRDRGWGYTAFYDRVRKAHAVISQNLNRSVAPVF